MSDEKPTEKAEPGDSPGEASPGDSETKTAEAAGSQAADERIAAKKDDAEPPEGDDTTNDEGAADDVQADAEASRDEPPREEAKGSKKKPETWTNTLIWIGAILLLLGIELYVYGHDGRIQVCVGIDKLTDYATKDEPRTKENAVKHPFCAERLNLGMWSSSEEQAKAALSEACSAAARIVGAEQRQKCLRRDDPWTRQTEKEQIMPWDERLYRRLLWLD